MVAFFFPGQGSQAVGMGHALAEAHREARETYQEADDALGQSISRICFHGSEGDLRRTEVTQPAILATSVAALRVLRANRPDLAPTFFAGHSLGEWTALVAAGSLAFPDALRLVRERGRLMQAAVPEGEGAMLAVIGLPPEAIAAICAEVAAETGAVFAPANFNSPEQTVVSGHSRAAEPAMERLRAAGAKKVTRLAVSAPFHCPLMAPVADGLNRALYPVEVRPPSAPVVSNVDAEPNRDPARVKGLLVAQVTGPVRWVEVVQRIAREGTTVGVELGPGRVLGTLCKRIVRGFEVHSIHDPATLDHALAELAHQPSLP